MTAPQLTTIAAQLRDCRCGPDGCADSACPGLAAPMAPADPFRHIRVLPDEKGEFVYPGIIDRWEWEHITRTLGDEMIPVYAAPVAPAGPIDMVLHCPACGRQHIDGPDREDDPSMLAVGITHKVYDGWTNPPHRSHLCHGCGHIWRPADVATNGVKAIKTIGKADSPLAAPAAPAPVPLTEGEALAEFSAWVASLPSAEEISMSRAKFGRFHMFIDNSTECMFDAWKAGRAHGIKA